MDCKKATDFIMKYLEDTITEAEAYELNQHLQNCDSCNKEFMAYEEVFYGLSNAKLTEPPEDFTNNIMACIYSLPECSYVKNEDKDHFISVIWGIASVLTGIGFLLYLNQGSIITFMSQFEIFKGFIVSLTDVSKNVNIGIFNMSVIINNFIAIKDDFLEQYKYIIIGFIGVLGVTGYYTSNRKVKNNA